MDHAAKHLWPGVTTAPAMQPTPVYTNVYTQVQERVAFGRPLVQYDTILSDIAQSRIDIDQARLLTLKAAHLMDTVGNKVSLYL